MTLAEGLLSEEWEGEHQVIASCLFLPAGAGNLIEGVQETLWEGFAARRC